MGDTPAGTRDAASADPVAASKWSGPPFSRRLLPWLAFAALFICHHAASAARWDVKDTHDRLDRIYKELGIEQEEEEPQGCGGQPVEEKKEKKEKEGCGCQPERPEQPEKPPSWRPPRMPAWLGYVLIGAILAAMLIPLILVLRGSFAGEVRSEVPPDEEEEEEAGPARLERGPWRVDLSECRALLQQGKVAEAFAALHRATLLALERARHLTLDETTTNWEYVRRLISKPSLRQMLAAVTLAAEQSVLGRRPPGPDHYPPLEKMVLDTVEEAGR